MEAHIKDRLYSLLLSRTCSRAYPLRDRIRWGRHEGKGIKGITLLLALQMIMQSIE